MPRIILKGKKVVLRPISVNDATRFCQWLKDSEVTQFLSIHGQPAPSVKEEKDWIRGIQKDKKVAKFAIDTINGVHIGSVSLADILNINNRALFGIFIGDKKYWGQGCGTEATKLIVDYGFIKLKLHRIYLQHYAFNDRAGQTYKKIGFKEEGRQRDHLLRGKVFHDVILMGILRKDWLLKNKKKK